MPDPGSDEAPCMHSKIFFQFFNRKDQSERDSLRDIVTTLARLRELGKPFVVIMPCSTLTTRYFRDLFQDIQVIVPRRRIQFRKLVDGVEVPAGRCSFDCLYFCWRLGLPRDVVFLT